MAMQDPYVVSSTNIFLDSKDDNNPHSRGDEVVLNLGNQAINADKGETIRLQLTQFTMHKNFFKVNENNNVVDVILASTAVPAGGNFQIALTPGNYQTTWQIYNEFAEQLRLGIIAQNVAHAGTTVSVTQAVLTTNPVGVNFPPALVPATGNETGQIMGQMTSNLFQLVITPPGGQNFTRLQLFCFEEVSDSYMLLGANKFPIGANLDVVPATTPYTIGSNVFGFGDQSFVWGGATGAGNPTLVNNVYPAQQQTDAHIYVRTNLLSNNICQTNLNAKARPVLSGSSATSSDILAKIPIDTEYANYDANFEDVYFLSLTQKHVDTLKVYITDSRSRNLGRNNANEGLLTAAGYQVAGAYPNQASWQSRFGNLSFSCVIRVDIIKAFNPKLLQSAPIKRVVKARDVGVLENMDFGKNAFNDN